jgi:hypothetical protein
LPLSISCTFNRSKNPKNGSSSSLQQSVTFEVLWLRVWYVPL